MPRGEVSEDYEGPLVVRSIEAHPGLPTHTPIVVTADGVLDPIPNAYLLAFARTAAAGRGSWRTVETYAAAVQRVLGALHDRGLTLEALDPETVRGLADDWTFQGLSPAKHNLNLVVLMGLLETCHRHDVPLDPNLVRLCGLDAQRAPRRSNIFKKRLRRHNPPPRPPAPSDGDLEKLFAAFGTRRDRLMAGLGLLAGLRREEIASLPSSAVRTALQRRRGEKSALMRVTGKGRKTRNVRVPVKLLQPLDEYMRQDRQAIVQRFCPETSDAVFLSRRTGRALRPESVGRIVADAAKRAGVDVATHGLRRKFVARWLARRGAATVAELSDLRDQMGHARMETLLDVYVVGDPDREAVAAEAAEDRTFLEGLR